MSDETIFYVIGIALTILALVASFIGLRFENLPGSRRATAGVLALFAVLVLGATAFAWTSAEEEQEHRDEEIAAGHLPSPAEIMEEMGAATATDEQQEEGEPTEPTAGEASVGADGAALFDAQGCGSCHALAAADSTGEVGPDLDASLKGEDAAFIEESIVDPDAEVEEGYPEGVMPSNFGDVLTPEELEALVQYIADSVGAKS
jgi:mono/diheme cytochrome c family protein